MRILKAIYRVFAAIIDVKLGLLGALFLGTAVFFINYHHGWQLGLSAALKQGIYTFFFGGFIAKLCEYLSTRLTVTFWALLWGTLVPSLLAVGATFGVHSLRSTPEPLLSTLPTIVTTLPSFLGISIRKRKKYKAYLKFKEEEEQQTPPEPAVNE